MKILFRSNNSYNNQSDTKQNLLLCGYKQLTETKRKYDCNDFKSFLLSKVKGKIQTKTHRQKMFAVKQN